MHWKSLQARISFLLGGLLLGLRGFNFLGSISFSGCSFNWGSMTVTVSGFSFLDILGEDFIVLGLLFLGFLESVDLLSLHELLSSDSLFSNESLDLWWFVESLITLLDFSSNNVLSNIVLLSESEDLSNVAGSLGAESSWLVTVGNTFDFLVTLLDDSEGNDSKIWATDATSNRLSLSLTGSSGSVSCCLYFKYN